MHAVLLAIRRPPKFQAEIRSKRGLESRQCSAIIVSNNPFGEGHIPHADKLDGGVLGVYIAAPMQPRRTRKAQRRRDARELEGQSAGRGAGSERR